jgi:2-polyprenyl-3-methyl-5-hydroxy-6-metoxy-1,4-benzoquinol methylase
LILIKDNFKFMTLQEVQDKSWSEISKDPNAPEVLKHRRDQLIRSGATTVAQDRVSYLSSLARGKKVLDVGVVEHTREAVLSPNWLHRNLVKESKSCLGVDILQEEVDYLVSLGFNIVCADIVKQPLLDKFDLIVCGEVLEHISNVGDFMSSLSLMLESDGRLVVTVPNPWYINVILKNMFGKSPFVDNADHVSWFDPCTFTEMGKRNGLILDKFIPVAIDQTPSLLSKIFFGLTPIFVFLGFQPRIFAKSTIYEFILARKV